MTGLCFGSANMYLEYNMCQGLYLWRGWPCGHLGQVLGSSPSFCFPLSLWGMPYTAPSPTLLASHLPILDLFYISTWIYQHGLSRMLLLQTSLRLTMILWLLININIFDLCFHSYTELLKALEFPGMRAIKLSWCSRRPFKPLLSLW